jgi:hypothetical protein
MPNRAEHRNIVHSLCRQKRPHDRFKTKSSEVNRAISSLFASELISARSEW